MTKKKDGEVEVVKDGDGAILANAMKELQELKNKMQYMEMANTTYQPTIEGPPVPKANLYGQACANDGVTVASWMDQWIAQTEENGKNNNFVANSVYNEWGKGGYKPVIIAGSGPSLRRNFKWLTKEKRGDITLVSCLHNFAFFEDAGIEADYYLNLDAGTVTIEEMAQGGTQDAEYYWNLTEQRHLVTCTHTHPEINRRWKGKKSWFRTIMPHAEGQMKSEEVNQGLDIYFNVGGNTLGACLYMARAILGGCPIAFVGADFAFGRDKKFHPFDSPYDKQYDGLIPCTNVFGDRVYTWQSYFNFKSWFEFIAMGGQGNNYAKFFNCTEGGILGAYPQGNIKQIEQLPLELFVKMYDLHRNLPETKDKKMLLF